MEHGTRSTEVIFGITTPFTLVYCSINRDMPIVFVRVLMLIGLKFEDCNMVNPNLKLEPVVKDSPVLLKPSSNMLL